MNDIQVLNQLGKSKIQMMQKDSKRFFVRAIMAGVYVGIRNNFISRFRC
ncbi:MAG: hypothetical protein LUF02_08360 [Erysipelotrichaceae bacterium]|nr:hypothetical protein [Erysipelotrichaceae bacterium]